MTPSIATYIMHHPLRAFPGILESVLVRFPLVVAVDDQSNGPWWNARRCWLDGVDYEGATHVLVVHDDAVPSPGAAESLLAAVAARPNDILSFHSTRPELIEAMRQGKRWVAYDTFCWGLALCLPVHHARALVEWCDEHIVPDWRADDTRVLLYAQAHGLPIYCSAPSLFQHPADGHGVLGNPNDASPWVAKGLVTDWSGEPLIVPGDRRNYLVSRSKKFVGGRPSLEHVG